MKQRRTLAFALRPNTLLRGFRSVKPVCQRRLRWSPVSAPSMKRGGDQFGAGPDVVIDIDVRDWLRQRECRRPGLHISEPVEITCFSRDGERKVDFGSRDQLEKYSEPQLGSDLGENFDSFREKADGDFGVEPVVGALQSANYDIDGLADVITYRNNLNKITGTPYNGRDEWEMDSVMIDNSVFLDVRKLDERPPSAMHKRFMYFGYRFESLCTDTKDEPVDANAEFCSIIRLRVGQHRILFGGEIDCEKPADSSRSPLQNYVELKTMREPKSDRDFQNMYRHRFLKYWIQSYLAGVRTVVLGYRNDHGILQRVDHFETLSFPRLARQHLTPRQDFRGSRGNSQGSWEPFVCLNFLNSILNEIRRACSQNPGVTIRVRYDPQRKRLVGRTVPGSDFCSRMKQQLKPELPEQAAVS